MKITMHADGRWSYDQIADLAVRGRAELFRPRDRATLRKITEPALNPLAVATVLLEKSARLLCGLRRIRRVAGSAIPSASATGSIVSATALIVSATALIVSATALIVSATALIVFATVLIVFTTSLIVFATILIVFATVLIVSATALIVSATASILSTTASIVSATRAARRAHFLWLRSMRRMNSTPSTMRVQSARIST
jgi:hypothetical protein